MADEHAWEAALRGQDLLSTADMVVGAIDYFSPLETTEIGNNVSIGQQRDASEEAEINAQALYCSEQQPQSLESYNYSFPKNNGVLNPQVGNKEKDIGMTAGKESIPWNYFKGCSGTSTTREDDLTAADSLLLLQAAPRYSERSQQHFCKAMTPVSSNPMNEEENHAQISHDRPEYGSATSIRPNSQEVLCDYQERKLDESYQPLDGSDFQSESVNASFSFSSQSESHDSNPISVSEGFCDCTVSDISAVFSEEGETSNFEDSRTTSEPNESEFRDGVEIHFSSPSLHQERNANGIYMSSPDIVSDVQNDSGVSSSHMPCSGDESYRDNYILLPKCIEDNMISIHSLPIVERNSFMKLSNDSSTECNPNVEGDNAVKHNYKHVEDDEISLTLSSSSKTNYHINPNLVSSRVCQSDISSVPASQDEQTSEVKPEQVLRENYKNPNVEGDNAVKHNYKHIEYDEIPLDLSSSPKINYHINPNLLSSGDCQSDISSIPASQEERTSEVKPEQVVREDYENPDVEGDNSVKHNHEHIEYDEIPLDLSSSSKINYHINPNLLSNGNCQSDIPSVPASQAERTSAVKPEQLLRKDYENYELQSVLQRLHCPFVWKPDVTVSQDPNFRAQENIVDYLTDKEQEFRSAKPNIFRRIVIRLVLSYEKAKAGRYHGAIKELEQCHQMLKEYTEQFTKSDNRHQTEEPKFICDSTGSGENENHLYQWSKSSEEEDCFKDCNMREDSHKEEEESAGNTEMEVMDPAEEERLAGYWYVVVSSLAHVMALSGDVNRALEFAQGCILTYDELGSISQAAVVALHGAVFCEYGNEGNALGLEFLKKAVEMDPEYWQWNLNLGKVLGRLRRIYKSVTAKPDDEELQLLEKAVVLRPQEAATMVHLANVYRGLASAIYREANAQGGPAVGRPTSRRQHYQSHEDYRRSHMMPRHTVRCAASDDYLGRAKQLYMTALAQEPDCPYNNARCAKGLWSMPYPFRDKETAQKAIIHALSIAPDDSLVNHYAGLFYEFNHDYDKALNCYERATADGKNNFPAHMSYVSLRMKISPGNYSPLLLLDYILRKYTSPNNQIHTLCARAFYHRSDKQPMLAVRYFRKAIEVDPSHFTLKNFHPPSVFGYCGFACDIYEILREILNDLKHGRDYLRYKSIIDETERFLDSIQNHSTSS